jgi:hypothetical protein
MSTVCGSSLFGNGFNYIKVGNGEIVAIQGSNTMERLPLSDLRIPYKQLLKSRIILKPGETNYLLNFLGLGDNATFLAMKVIYDPKSKKESENYLTWSFYDNLTTVNTIGQLMVLTGNSENRIKQIYLTNPNTKYPVSIEVMVGVIDDENSFFNDTLNQSGTSFVNLEWSDIKPYILGESIKVVDNLNSPLIYLILNNIQSIEKSGNILIINDTSLGSIFLQFKTEFDVNQAYSLLNYILENPNIDFNNIQADEEPPAIYWNEFVLGTTEWITLDGATAGAPYSTLDGLTFSTEIGLTAGLDSNLLIDLLVDYVEDNRDGLIMLSENNLVINDGTNNINEITATGSYQVTFNVSDLATNELTATMNLMIV